MRVFANSGDRLTGCQGFQGDRGQCVMDQGLLVKTVRGKGDMLSEGAERSGLDV